MTIRTTLSCLLTLTSSLALSACMDCSQAGCGAQLNVDIQDVGASDGLTLEVCRDGACYGPAAMGDLTATLVSNDDLHVQAYLSMDATGQRSVRVEANEYDDRMSLEDPPASVPWIVRLRDGATLVFEETLTPDYVTSFPNGEACGPTCFTASGSFHASNG